MTLAQVAETLGCRAENNAEIVGAKTYVILNILGHLSVVLSGAGLIFFIFLSPLSQKTNQIMECIPGSPHLLPTASMSL